MNPELRKRGTAGLRSLVPAVIGASTFACSDVFGKVVFRDGGDVLTLVTFRGIIGLACIAAWLRIGAPPVRFKPRERWIALGLGLLFAFGRAGGRAALLLITRATLAHADPRLTAWYSMLSSSVVFVAISLATWTWHPPASVVGWAAMVGTSLTTTVAILAVFISAS